MSYSSIKEESVKRFCAVGTGQTEDCVAFQRWFNYASRALRTLAGAGGDAAVEFDIERYLRTENRDVLNKFVELNRRFQSLPSPCAVTKKNELLQFLVKVCHEKKRSGSPPASVFVSPDLFAGKQRTAPRRDSTETVDADAVSSASNRISRICTDDNVSEQAVLQELVFAFQGVGGAIFRDDFGDGSFSISPRVPAPLRQQAAHLAELGTMHVKVRKMVEQIPLVGAPNCLSALSVAIKLQLNEFCRLVAQIEAQVYGSEVNLMKLRVITWTTYTQMRWLVTVAETCKDKKGGALLSALHGLLQHGDPKVQSWIQPLLAAASRPFYEMLYQWLTEGHVEDPYAEFFVAVDAGASRDDFWHHKFSIRENMRPIFLSLSQANVVLATGKSVAFLRDVCKEEPMRWPELDAALLSSRSSGMWAMDGDLQASVDLAHRDVSKRALKVMLQEGKLSLHLEALRKYLLLGQGDFVHQLIENLEPKLSQPASQLYTHQLTPLLEAAVRSTNAQYDDQDILARLDVKLMQMSPGETGWDTFTLQYCFEGPIAMIFTNEVNTKYLCIFNALWRAKRMEWVLSNLWQRQTTSARMLRKITELTPVLRETTLLVSEMNQLIRQMQYYLLFESVECHWSELQKAVESAVSLDQLICAHDAFLDNTMKRALLDQDSGSLQTQLRSVYNSVLQLQSVEGRLSDCAHAELQRREAVLREAERMEKENKFGVTAETEALENKTRREFRRRVKDIRAELHSLASSYQEMVKTFLLALACHVDEDLQFLSYRLDFNEFYKNSDKRLSAPFTLNYRRKSGRPVP